MLLILVAGMALAAALYAGLRRLEARGGGLTGRAVEISRNPAVLKRIALAAALVAIGVAIAVGGRAWNQFTASDVQFPNQPAHHFESLSSANRNRVLAASRSKPSTKSRCSATAPAPTSSPGTSCARSRCR